MQCDKRCFKCQCRVINLCLKDFYEYLERVKGKVKASMEQGKYDEVLADVNVLCGMSRDLQLHFFNLRQTVQQTVEPHSLQQALH